MKIKLNNNFHVIHFSKKKKKENTSRRNIEIKNWNQESKKYIELFFIIFRDYSKLLKQRLY